jgi:hypothetical protein
MRARAGSGKPSGHGGHHGNLRCPGAPTRPQDHRSEREILRLIPNIRSRLLFVSPRTGSRSGLLRDAANHLRRGRALLTFPAGTIEPDPSVRVVDTLAGWSDSSELLVRLVPETIVLPIAVSGVISRTAHRHPIARRFADAREREWAAATLQVLFRHLRDTRTRVAIGAPISSRQPNQRAAIYAAMASLLGVSDPDEEDLTADEQICQELAIRQQACCDQELTLIVLRTTYYCRKRYRGGMVRCRRIRAFSRGFTRNLEPWP